MSETTERVSQVLREHLDQLEQEAKRIEGALRPLGGRPAAVGRNPAGKSSGPIAPRQPRRAKRAARGERQAQLLAAIKANPTQGPAELAKTIGIAPSQAHALVAKARAEKLISKQGKGYSVKATATKATEPKSG
jgi:hypothetical protein